MHVRAQADTHAHRDCQQVGRGFGNLSPFPPGGLDFSVAWNKSLFWIVQFRNRRVSCLTHNSHVQSLPWTPLGRSAGIPPLPQLHPRAGRGAGEIHQVSVLGEVKKLEVCHPI